MRGGGIEWSAPKTSTAFFILREIARAGFWIFLKSRFLAAPQNLCDLFFRYCRRVETMLLQVFIESGLRAGCQVVEPGLSHQLFQVIHVYHSHFGLAPPGEYPELIVNSFIYDLAQAAPCFGQWNYSI